MTIQSNHCHEFKKQNNIKEARLLLITSWCQALPPQSKLILTAISSVPDFFFFFQEKEMATHPSVLAWRIPGTGEPGGLPSMGSHRVGHD